MPGRANSLLPTSAVASRWSSTRSATWRSTSTPRGGPAAIEHLSLTHFQGDFVAGDLEQRAWRATIPGAAGVTPLHSAQVVVGDLDVERPRHCGLDHLGDALVPSPLLRRCPLQERLDLV